MALTTDALTPSRLPGWTAVAIAAAGVLVAYWSGIVNMAEHWGTGEYSHGPFIAMVSVWMAAQRTQAVSSAPVTWQWLGVAAVGLALILAFLGETATLYIVLHYALILCAAGLTVAFLGLPATIALWAPIAYLVFMIPIPDFLYFNLSNQLQLFSTEIGVWVIRLLGIPVFVEGNIIDLGAYKLQVAEACSGLRYLFPFVSFGFLTAFIYRGPWWHRAIIFVSTVPIAVLMNSFRIGVIGILVNVWGTATAEGFMHYFEGWVVFVICLVILFAEAYALMRLSRLNLAFEEAFDLDVPDFKPLLARLAVPPVPVPFLAATGLVVAGAIASLAFTGRAETVPERRQLLSFPMVLGEWHGKEDPIAPEILAQLKLEDYLSANYVSDDTDELVNLYVAYYGSQRKGQSVHSPRSCIPGGGWEIESLRAADVQGADGTTRRVNRLIIGKGTSRQLVYYWFEQRGRRLTSEYLVKWYILYDSLTMNRSDGALVRLVTPLGAGEPIESADKRLVRFLGTMEGALAPYIPD